MTESEILAALGTVLDPEVGIDIVNLGLIVDLDSGADSVGVRMIMTSVACPMHAHLVSQAEAALRKAAGPGVEVKVEVVTDPVWTPERMSDEARKKLGW
ncbi:MAG: metal-sulfur cluster assembly factor [Candidatus Krumholzibacteriota bacterium]